MFNLSSLTIARCSNWYGRFLLYLTCIFVFVWFYRSEVGNLLSDRCTCFEIVGTMYVVLTDIFALYYFVVFLASILDITLLIIFSSSSAMFFCSHYNTTHSIKIKLINTGKKKKVYKYLRCKDIWAGCKFADLSTYLCVVDLQCLMVICWLWREMKCT